MFTDAPPRKGKLSRFEESDRTGTLVLPQQTPLLALTQAIQHGMRNDNSAEVCVASERFLKSLAQFYHVPDCPSRVRASRPLRIRENWSSELFGDYDPSTMSIRVGMRTAVKKDITSFGTFLSTLCHEYCHHLWHTPETIVLGRRGCWPMAH